MLPRWRSSSAEARSAARRPRWRASGSSARVSRRPRAMWTWRPTRCGRCSTRRAHRLTTSISCSTPAPEGSVLHMRDLMDFFKYPASRLQSEFDLANATVAGIDQQGCAAIFSAVRLARATLLAEPDVRTVLCVSADRLPHGSSREVVYNLVSDGACAMLVRRGTERNRIIASHQVTKGAFWDSGSLENEIIAAYFPTARTVIEDTLRKAGITLDDIALVIPHNVSLRSWEILMGLIGCPREKL